MSNNTPATDHSPDAGKMVETPTAGQDGGEKSTHTPEPWFPCHPMGGTEIFRDGETHEPLAKFSREADCERAIECVNALAGVHLDHVSHILRERDELRAEVERLNSLLRAALDSREFNKQAADRLQAENAELREKLETYYGVITEMREEGSRLRDERDAALAKHAE